MALLQPALLDSTVAIGTRTKEWIGTGFIYGFLHEEGKNVERKGEVYLVTNKHVLEGLHRIIVQFNDKSGGSSDFFHLELYDNNGKPLYFNHPNSDIDISIINIEYDLLSKFKAPVIDNKVHTYSINEMSEIGVIEGDFIYVVGYPLGMANVANKKRAIVRHGCISRISDLYEENSNEFLIDSPVFPGNSGSPVIIRPEKNSIDGTKVVKEGRIIGIVTGFIKYNEVAYSKNDGEIIFSTNTGLAIVHPIDYIDQTITEYESKFINP